jgi:hypothetical protein
LLHRKFRRVHAKALRLRVGSRVSVYDQDNKNRYYPATVIKIKPKRPRPHCVEYDAEFKNHEDLGARRKWLNLNVHPFFDIEPRPVPANISNDDINKNDIPAPIISNANTLKKRKRQFLKDPPPPFVVDHDAANTKQSPKRAKKEERSIDVKTSCKEMCAICHSMTLRPRALSCHHLLCKCCVDDLRGDDAHCPLCPTVTIDVNEVVKYNVKNKDQAYFKPVEALDRTTAQVVKTYPSASAASIDFLTFGRSCSGMLLPFRIMHACQSKRRDDREYKGFYWRFQGCKDRILRVGEAIKDGIPVEQVDIVIGEVIETFPSGRKAAEKTGVCRGVIRRILERRGKAVAGGFFWRYEGETHGPWPDHEPEKLDPVEQLDYETGDLLTVYDSLAEAKKALGMRSNSACIRAVCNGSGRATDKGFFWRWKGSDRLPNHMMGVQKIIQIRKTKKGKVVKEFRTSRDAQAYFGYQECWSTLCYYCREKSFYKGFYWHYRKSRGGNCRKATSCQTCPWYR